MFVLSKRPFNIYEDMGPKNCKASEQKNFKSRFHYFLKSYCPIAKLDKKKAFPNIQMKMCSASMNEAHHRFLGKRALLKGRFK